MCRCEMRRCENKKIIDRPPLLEEPFAQTLSGKRKFKHKQTLQCAWADVHISMAQDVYMYGMFSTRLEKCSLKMNIPGLTKPWPNTEGTRVLLMLLDGWIQHGTIHSFVLFFFACQRWPAQPSNATESNAKTLLKHMYLR